MINLPSKTTIERLRRQYPSGSCVKLVKMNDLFSTIRPGDHGTVEFIDDIGTIFCSWDRGSSLGVVFGEDEVVLIKEADDD